MYKFLARVSYSGIKIKVVKDFGKVAGNFYNKKSMR